jgi:hypothetical protein
MLGVALRTLFADLDHIPEHDRSDYESALHQELAELAEATRPSRSRFAFVDVANSLTGLGQAFKAMRLSRSNFEGIVDVGPMPVGNLGSIDASMTDTPPSWDASNVTRLRCSNSACPNKRR